MGVKVKFDLGALKAALENAGEKAHRHATAALEESAHIIAETAQLYAPYKTGALERAIRVDKPRQQRGADGRFGSVTVPVYVDGDDGVDNYAGIMHEELQPFGDGDLELGKGSQAKDGGAGVVGGKFFERAIEENADEVRLTVLNELRKVL